MIAFLHWAVFPVACVYFGAMFGARLRGPTIHVSPKLPKAVDRARDWRGYGP